MFLHIRGCDIHEPSVLSLEISNTLRPIIEEIMRAGVTSHNAIAQKLNEHNVRTARGGTWTHVQVGAILHPFEVAAVNAALIA